MNGMKKMKMQLFGTFRLWNETAVLTEEMLHSNKLTKLLVYLLMNRSSMLTHQKLIELFANENSKNPETALKNQMYLLRKALKVFGSDTYICTGPGNYYWNPEIKVESDYEAFERMADTIKRSQIDEAEKMALCREILACYQGNVSGKVVNEQWMLPKAIWYQSIYVDIVKTFCELLAKQEEWTQIEQICSQVLHTEPLDEDLHCYLMMSLHRQKKYDMALDHYEKTNKQFYESVGIRHPEKLKETFRALLSEDGKTVMNLENLMEEIRENKMPNGVFFCDYQIFRQIYQMEVRRSERLGIAEHIVLFTLQLKGNTTAVDKMLMGGMELLEQTIRTSLRIGDVASRYSQTQFIVLLPMCTYESAQKVVDRILKKFYRAAGKGSLKVYYELSELSS